MDHMRICVQNFAFYKIYNIMSSITSESDAVKTSAHSFELSCTRN